MCFPMDVRSILPESDLDEVVDAARPAFEKLRGARLFLTGGTGFWGTWLVDSLMRANERLSLGVEVVVLTRDAARSPAHASLRFVHGDVRDFGAPDGAFTHIVHCATASAFPASASETFDTVVRGTKRVLELAREKNVSRVLYASSGAVYGRQPPALLNMGEDRLCAPDAIPGRTPYGDAKRAAEALCTAADGPDCVIARGFAFAGPLLPLDAHFAIGNFIRDAIAGHEIVVRGDGTPWRSYLYASDLAVWLWTLLVEGRRGRAYNVGSEEGVQIGALARMIGAHFGGPVSVLGKPDADAPAERYVPSTERARTELGLRQRIPLPESIRRTGEWAMRNVGPTNAAVPEKVT